MWKNLDKKERKGLRSEKIEEQRDRRRKEKRVFSLKKVRFSKENQRW